MQKSTSL